MTFKDEELGLEVGTKDEAAWTQIKENIEKQTEDMKRSVEINENVLKFCEKKLKELAKN